MKDRVKEIITESIRLKEEALKKTDLLIEAAEMIALAFTYGRKIMIFGNGGSAADAQHMACEFVNRFIIERPPLPAVALTTDTSTLTAIGNDYSFNEVFSKQVKAIGQEGDVALGISTSGNSTNVVEGLRAARDRQIRTIAMTGGKGGMVKPVADLLLNIDSKMTPRVQEVHVLWIHVICDLVDYILFQRPGEESSS